MQAAPGSLIDDRRPRLFWWKELAIAVVFYAVYSWARNQFGSNRVATLETPLHAFHNAEKVIRFERIIGLFHEETIQDIFLPFKGFIRVMNIYYGTAHFVVTIAVFAILFVKRPNVFPQWRNTLAVMTGLAIFGFSLFPLMPPRLLDAACADLGGACIPSRFRPAGGGFGFVDTLAEFGGWWSFGSGGMETISNQYAAMPSLHIGWSTWCAMATWPLLSRPWQRVAVFLYPLLTLFCIIVTANHYWLDGVGGLVVFGLGAVIGWSMHRLNLIRIDRKLRRRLADSPADVTDVGDAAAPVEPALAEVDAGAQVAARQGPESSAPG